MRKLLIGIGVCVLARFGQAFAQSPNEKLYEKGVVLSSGPNQPTPADRVHERAAREARERLARIESRRWNGISLQRPTVYTGPNFIYLNSGVEQLNYVPWAPPVMHACSYAEWYR